jgi:hypothetical protein
MNEATEHVPTAYLRGLPLAALGRLTGLGSYELEATVGRARL